MEEIKIGNQIWMTENLKVEKFRNDDSIPQAKTDEEWKEAGDNNQPAWCYYDNDPANDIKYGKLYNWHAVNDPRGLAPIGRHIPTDDEWSVLIDYLGGEDDAGDTMKSKEGWDNNGNGTNSSGFSGLPGGYRYYGGPFDYIDGFGGWWSSSEGSTGTAWYCHLHYSNGSVDRDYYSKGKGLSVRCLRD